MLRIIFLHIALVLLPIAAGAMSRTERDAIADSLRHELRHAETPADSVGILCNLYDLLPRTASNAIGDTLYHTAMRANDQHTALDVIRNQASRLMRSREALERLTSWAMACTDGNDRRETLTFIRLMNNIRFARYSDSVERNKALKMYLEELKKDPTDDVYEHIAIAHGICMLISNGSSNEILAAYMDSLGKIINRLPPSAYSIRNSYNVHAATVFATVNPKKSIESDLKSLKDIARLERYYRDKGRLYRNYHATYYTIYTRILSNYTALTPEQVESYYTKAIDQLDADEAIRRTYERTPMPDIYYSMYHKDYPRALKLINHVMADPNASHHNIRLLKYLIECTEALGYKETRIEIYKQYTDALENELKNTSDGNFRELQTAYAIYEMKHNLGLQAKEGRKTVAALQRSAIIVGSIAILILILFIIILFRQYRKNRHLAHSLSISNNKLIIEGENLKKSKADIIKARDLAQKANNLKTDFIKNMSYEVKVPLQAINEYSHLIADCVANSPMADRPGGSDPHSSRHLSHFADLLELNCDLLNTIVNDVLRLSDIESNPIMVQPQVTQVKALCEATISGLRRRVKPGVTMALSPDVTKVDLFTDPQRLQQILNNMLSNAAKFTDSGSITLSYGLDDEGKNMIFTVTDTGIGINPENKEKIFDRFFKIDRDSQGAGLGLTISRLIARQLGGDLWLDTTYRKGARFCLSIPKK